jgi:ubiquinone/menaquinone biosynthesis C-methylase UbiE
MDKIKRTANVYGFLWKRADSSQLPERWHYNSMQEMINEPIVRGRIGIDIGSGCGYDTYIMATNNPSVKIVGLDISDGIYKSKEINSRLKNACFIKGSALEIPIKENTFDFAYSFGVLHHTSDPEKCIRQIARVIKKGAPVFLYLYEDHSDNFIRYLSIKIITVLRKVTTKIHPKMLYAISFLVSPFVAFLFTYPAKLIGLIKSEKDSVNKIPFNFGTHPFSLAGDLYDRFSAPIEYRFNKKEAYALLNKNGFINIKIDKLPTIAGWLLWGIK